LPSIILNISAKDQKEKKNGKGEGRKKWGDEEIGDNRQIKGIKPKTKRTKKSLRYHVKRKRNNNNNDNIGIYCFHCPGRFEGSASSVMPSLLSPTNAHNPKPQIPGCPMHAIF